MDYLMILKKLITEINRRGECDVKSELLKAH
jgi:hypothetical protein